MLPRICVVAQDRLDETVERWVENMLACAPLSLKAIKHAVKNSAHLSVSEAMSLRHAPLMASLNAED